MTGVQLDPSIILKAQPVAIQNPLAQLQEAAQSRNALLGYQQNQAKWNALQSIGANTAQATRPDGTIDTAMANQLNAADPSAAIGIPEAAASNQALSDAQQGQAVKNQAHVNQTLVSLGTLPDADMNGATFRSAADSLLKAGSISPQAYQAAVGDLPPDGSAPQAYRQYVLRHAVANLGGQGAIDQVYGQDAVVNNGQQQIQGVLAPAARGGGFTPGSAVQNQTTPGENASLVRTYDPASKAYSYVPRSALPGANGVVGPAQAAAPAPDAALGSGRYGSVPSNLRNPAAAAAAQSVPPAQSQSVMAEPGPAQTAQMSAQGSHSAGAFADIAQQGVDARSQAGILSTMLGDSQNFTTGPQGLNQFKATITKYAPAVAGAFGVDPKSVAANESFDKFANQIAGAQGAGSDARLAVAQGGNPNSHTSPAGVDLILRQLQGNTDYIKARAQQAASYGDQTDRAGFEAKVGNDLDPRAFQYARLTPDQKRTYFMSLSSQDKAALKKSYGYAQSNSLLPPVNNGQQ